MTHLILWAAEQQGEGPPMWSHLMPFFLLFLVAYFLFLRPMQRQESVRRAAVQAMKKNDKVITSGGIIGIVDSIKENENEILLKGGLRVTKTSIVEVVPGGEREGKD